MSPDRIKINKKYVYGALIFYWIILLAATSVPSSSLPEMGGSDKVKHFLAYAVLSILLTLTLQLQEKKHLLRKRAYFFSILFALSYGLLDEIHQAFIPGRYCEFLDWLADFGGAAAGSLMVYLINYFNDTKSKQNSRGTLP